MANSLCFCRVISFKSPHKPGVAVLTGNSAGGRVFKFNSVFHHHGNSKFQSLEVKATDSSDQTTSKSTKVKSIVCTNCEGNGAIQCSQCKGSGVNITDHFNGQFKAGGLCWLCRGKREILCGECNGAGFLGGFLSTFDD